MWRVQRAPVLWLFAHFASHGARKPAAEAPVERSHRRANHRSQGQGQRHTGRSLMRAALRKMIEAKDIEGTDPEA
jgi:hypothetical protein